MYYVEQFRRRGIKLAGTKRFVSKFRAWCVYIGEKLLNRQLKQGEVSRTVVICFVSL